MFEIELNLLQLLKTFELLNSNSTDSDTSDALNRILKECRFLISSNEIQDSLTEIIKYGPHRIHWAGNHLAINTENNLNPFKINIKGLGNNLLDSNIDKLLIEKELLVKSGTENNPFHFDMNVSNFLNEIIIIDKFLLVNSDLAASSINNLLTGLTPENVKRIHILTSKCGGNIRKTYFETIVTEFKKIGFDCTICFLVLDGVYHDRDLFSNIFRIKSGGSFDTQGKTSKIEARTVEYKSMLINSNISVFWEIINLFLNAYELKYKRNKMALQMEIDFLSDFESSNLYKHWKIIKN
jgi:hypothetical protein